MNYIIYILILLINFSCDSGGSIVSPPNDVIGCMDSLACNYNSDATTEGLGSSSPCWYENEGCSCDNEEGAILDCNNTCGGFAAYDNCGLCSGGDTGISTDACIVSSGCDLPLNTIGIIPKSGSDIYGTIIYNIDPHDSLIGIAGFQFDIEKINLIEDALNPNIPFAGGDAALSNLTITGSLNTNTIIGFSVAGDIIQVNNDGELCGELTNIAYENDFTSNSDKISLTNIVFADQSGYDINVNYYDTCFLNDYDCNGMCGGTAYIDLCEQCVEGLTGNNDCSDGYVDCYGNIGIDADINVTVDCEGVCGGSATIDDCGLCNGPGIPAGFCDCFNNIDDCAGVCDGDSMLDCSGVCGGTASVDCDNVCNGTSVTDCFGVCGGTAVEDECGICDGDGTSCQLTACNINDNSIYLNEVNSNVYNVFYNITEAFNGFQFNISNATLANASGGDAIASGFTVQTNPSSGVVLGFSFSGSSIDAGCGTLTNLTLNNASNPTISDIVFSSPNGDSINITIHD